MTEDEIMLTSILGCSRSDLIVNNLKLSNEQEKVYSQMKSRRLAREPLQYILGTWDFMGIELEVTPNVLIPRPETELLVEEVLNILNNAEARDRKVLDLGTGSGNIAIALAKFYAHLTVTAVDVSAGALKVAKANARKVGVNEKISFIESDMTEFLKRQSASEERFDMIVSNPPYVETSKISALEEELHFEPKSALDGGEDGLLFYKNILTNAGNVLTRDGIILFEIADHLLEPLCAFLNAMPQWKFKDCIKDYSQLNRILIIEKKKAN